MIRSFTFINYLNEAVYVDITRPQDTGFAIVNVDGLGPVKATINTTAVSTGDGSFFNSARCEERNIVISLIFYTETDKPTIEDIRQLTYKYFPLKKPITILVETDNRTLFTVGYTESNNPTIFSENEGTQISIICPDNNLYEYDPTEQSNDVLSYIRKLFEFPFSNESLSESLKIMGEIMDDPEIVINYPGDTEVGMTMTLHFYGAVSHITLSKIDTSETMIIDTDKIASITGTALGEGDEIIIDTRFSNKSVTLLRDGVKTNILNCINRNASWFVLHKGDNIFGFDADSGKENLTINIDWDTAYEGV